MLRHHTLHAYFSLPGLKMIDEIFCMISWIITLYSNFNTHLSSKMFATLHDFWASECLSTPSNVRTGRRFLLAPYYKTPECFADFVFWLYPWEHVLCPRVDIPVLAISSAKAIYACVIEAFFSHLPILTIFVKIID